MNLRIPLSWTAIGAVVFTALFAVAACGRGQSSPVGTGPVPLAEPHTRVVADGLFGPVGLEALPDGSMLIAEEGTGGRDDSAGVTLLLPDGSMGRLISGLPSTRDSGDLAGVPLVKLSPDGATLYVGNFGAGHVWTLASVPRRASRGLGIAGHTLHAGGPRQGTAAAQQRDGGQSVRYGLRRRWRAGRIGRNRQRGGERESRRHDAVLPSL